MSLCPSCRNVNIPNLLCKLDHLPPWWEQVSSKSTPQGMVHLHDARNLPLSASAGCPLCGLILDAALQDTNRSIPSTMSTQSSQSHRKRTLNQSIGNLTGQPVYLRPNYDPQKSSFPEDGPYGAWHVRGFKAFVPVDRGVLTGWVRLFADRDSPAGLSGDVIGRPPLPSSDSPEAYELVERCMHTCLTKHAACKETLSSTVVDETSAPVLPTRVIYIGYSNAVISPRLLETNGTRGHYVALSHCWGSQAHRPPMTTRASLVDHLTGIPWSSLPKTYQDAITASQRLGFEYIWIDSLAIIQDDFDDWLRESQLMGDVYQSARLTIAASHAADSRDPCFFTRKPPLPAIELPHMTATGQVEGSIFASLLPPDYATISPESGPLALRAWATQEWLLSRRMIFYTADSLVWSCKTISQRETGASFHSTARNHRWKNIVEKYSARLLTKQTDRLVALDGIRAAVALKRPEDTYCLGLWKNSMPDQLLWYRLQPAERGENEIQLPTWTWASSLHGVRFLDIKAAKNACEEFRFDPGSHELSIRSVLEKVARLSPQVELDAATLVIEDSMVQALPASMLHTLHTDDGSSIGWCVLDEGAQIEGDVYAFRLMSKDSRSKHEGVKETIYEEWALLLQRVDGMLDQYRRIGVARLTTTQPWFGDAALSWVRIS